MADRACLFHWPLFHWPLSELLDMMPHDLAFRHAKAHARRPQPTG